MSKPKLSLIVALLLAFCFAGISSEATAAPAGGAIITLVKHVHRKPHKRRHKHRRHKHKHKMKTLGTLPKR
ncbi:MAG TPA: hypothetical protein VLI90_11190 [Tepidisphaeraceae bacterium]|nr:hypothetical protein [Tepidisphaeraceae bacterium]